MQLWKRKEEFLYDCKRGSKRLHRLRLVEQTAPEVFQLQGGTAQAISGEVPPHCEEAAKEAASNCPVSVIHID